MSSSLRILAAVALLSVAVSAQSNSNFSGDPLNGSTFVTPTFSQSNTFTPVTTFPSAGTRTPTSIAGPAGPSPATSSFGFSYGIPLSTVSAVPNPSLTSSLAADGQPTQQSAAFSVNPDGIQIVDAATGAKIVPLFTLGMAFAAGVAVVGAAFL